MDWVQEMSRWLGRTVLWFGGAVTVAFAAFRFLGSKWIEDKFATRLQAHKHAQAKELEELRHKINSTFNRLTKIHQKEFEVLPEAWNKLQDALGRTSGLTSLYQEYPDLNRMEESQLAEFLRRSDLYDFEKEGLLKEDDRNTYHMERKFWHDLKNAKGAFHDFHNYMIRNRIFLSSDLFQQFQKVDDIIGEAIICRECGEGDGDMKMWTNAYKKIRDEIDPIRDEIERLIQKRLRYHEAG